MRRAAAPALMVFALLAALSLTASAVGEHYWDAGSFYVNGSLVEWLEVHVYNASLGYVVYYWSAKGVYSGVYASDQGPLYWFVVGPREELIEYTNMTTWRLVWRVYEAPSCWAAPELRRVTYTHYVNFAVVESSEHDSIDIDNTTLTHCYDLVVFVDMPNNTLGAIVNVTSLVEEGCATCWPYTYAYNATLSFNATYFAEPPFSIRYDFNRFASRYVLPGWLVEARLTVGGLKAPYLAEANWGMHKEPAVKMYCSRLEGNETTVRIVIWDWAAAELNLTSDLLGFWFNGTVLAWRGDPAPTLEYINSTVIVFKWRLVVPRGVYSVQARYTLVDRSGAAASGTLSCLLIYRVLLRVPEYITTYEPRVEVVGCAYEYYTMEPLPGLRLDLVLNGTRLATVTTDASGCFRFVVELEKPGVYTLEYRWEDRSVARTVINYVQSGVPGIPGLPQIPVTLVPVPVSWSPRVLLPSVTLDTPTMVVLGFAAAALWLWLAQRTSISYATMTLGVVLLLLGVVYRTQGMIAAGVIAVVAGALLMRTGRL